MEFCPESRKYILGNILLQWLDLFLNAAMILLIAYVVQELYIGTLTAGNFYAFLVGLAVIIPLRWFTTRYASRMSYLASMTVKKKLRKPFTANCSPWAAAIAIMSRLPGWYRKAWRV